ncbi:hypothetical protein [Polaribacter sp. Q13]|uniref:hypothetical protein n=1 Tax=Polaribacter sp. Q13 TaxID=2806551 RepID=UPI00193C50FD|nr:hypothetical protein [Polaribacter sp. Q13]QVY66910.1 hypothetical protein JOP69_06400 [Polaribacter sp. Q13]
MAKQRKINSGDIFEIPIEEIGKKKFLQFIYSDKEILGGDLVRVFKFETNIENSININNIIKSEIVFYSYTMIKIGIKFSNWNKIGNIEIEKNFETPSFRYTEDYGKPNITKSLKWWIRKGSERFFIKELSEKYEKLSYDCVTHPMAFTQMIKLGYDEAKRPK